MNLPDSSELHNTENGNALPRITNFSNSTTSGVVLIVEDEEYIYQLLQIVLKQRNIKTIHASNGYAAIEMVKSNPEISLILMDGRMPEMHGTDATKIIKSIKPEIPVIALSGMTQGEEVEEALKAGCIDFVTKPIDMEDIVFKILKYSTFKN